MTIRQFNIINWCKIKSSKVEIVFCSVLTYAHTCTSCFNIRLLSRLLSRIARIIQILDRFDNLCNFDSWFLFKINLQLKLTICLYTNWHFKKKIVNLFGKKEFFSSKRCFANFFCEYRFFVIEKLCSSRKHSQRICSRHLKFEWCSIPRHQNNYMALVSVAKLMSSVRVVDMFKQCVNTCEL